MITGFRLLICLQLLSVLIWSMAAADDEKQPDQKCVDRFKKLISDRCTDGILAYGKCLKKYDGLASKLAMSCCKFNWCSDSMTNQLCCKTPSA